MTERAIELVLIFTSILFIVDPFAVIPTFLAMTVRDSPEQRRVLARRGAWTCAITLIAFAAGGSIINIGSVASEFAPATASVYSGTKAALNSITRSLAKELGPRKIRVNALSLGPVATEGYAAAGFPGSDFEKQAVQSTPLGRLGRPQEIASVAAFLASDDARWVSGAVIDVSGGWS